MRKKYLIFIIFLFLLSSCTWVADNKLVGKWGAKNLESYYIDNDIYYNYTGGDQAIFTFSTEGTVLVHWLVNDGENEYFNCYADNGKIEYWRNFDYSNKKVASYSISGSNLEVKWDGKTIKVKKL